MNIKVLTDSQYKQQLLDKIDELQEAIKLFTDLNDHNLAKLYKERQDIVIAELYDLDV